MAERERNREELYRDNALPGYGSAPESVQQAAAQDRMAGNGMPQQAAAPGVTGPMNDRQQPVAAEPAQDSAAILAATLPVKKPIGDNEIKEATATLNSYRAESQAIRQRIIENQLYYEFTSTSGRARKKSCCEGFTESVSAYLFNSIANKHADFMDNLPAPTLLPQEESDEETAKLLTEVVPCIFEMNRFPKKYSRACFDKLIAGAALYTVMWDGSAENGLGQISINNADLLNLYWKGGISELNDSPNLFYVTVEDNKELLMRYPQLKDHTGNGMVMNIDDFIYEDMPNRENCSLVIDWYYRRPTIMVNGAGERVVKNILHYCAFCNGVVLFASENETDPETGEPLYPNGYYEHGQYPYIIDTLFPIKGSPAGFGYVDVMKNPQEYIDKLDSAICENAEWKAGPHYLVPVGAGINTDDLKNPKKRIIQVSGLTDQCSPIETPALDGNVLSVRSMKTEELKETSGNTDFSQGTTSSGVTAASAIAALQEAGSKLSRDMIKNSYETYADMCTMIVELMRQFYTIARVYRITKDNDEYTYESISSGMLGNGAGGQMFGVAMAGRKPYFDIKVSAQKASPFSRAAQNELALQLYQQGFFNPELADQSITALNMMQFEGKDKLVTKISENRTLLEENTQLKQYVVQLANMLAESGDAQSAAMAQAIAQKFGGAASGAAGAAVQPAAVSAGLSDTDPLGNVQSEDTKTDRVRKNVQDRTEVS